MEESGHYYTVYFTSLAVGFDDDIAYRQAMLAQMPDEIAFLDATPLHLHNALGGSLKNLKGEAKHPGTKWRSHTEQAVHSLVDKSSDDRSSKFQQELTRAMLDNEHDVTSLKFGLLLHRLGDSYAHSMMDDESRMYTITTSGNFLSYFALGSSHGHLLDWHDPDYPFLRPTLFENYLKALYDVLLKKSLECHSRFVSQEFVRLSLDEVIRIFRHLFRDSTSPVQLTMRNAIQAEREWRMNSHFGDKGRNQTMPPVDWKQLTQVSFIQQIRVNALQHLKKTLRPYQPEILKELTLDDFLSQHPELSPDTINESTISDTITSIRKDMKTMEPAIKEKIRRESQ